ncbi:bone morphogenetic protein 2-B-like [Branchiostoma floridae x Branchiostoma japonicum]
MSVICAGLLFWGVFSAVCQDVGGVHGNQDTGDARDRLLPHPRHVGPPGPRTDTTQHQGHLLSQVRHVGPPGPRIDPAQSRGRLLSHPRHVVHPGPQTEPRADPSFMAELFHHLAGDSGARRTGPAPYGATTIRFYRSQESAVPFHLRHESGSLAMSFNVSSLQDTAVVTSAQLRVFRRAKTSWEETTSSLCRLYVFRTSQDGAKVRQPVSRRRFHSGSSGWEVFNITQCFSRQGADRVLQLVVKVKCKSGGNSTELVGPRNDTHHPSLVMYIRDSGESNTSEPPAFLPVTELPVRRGHPVTGPAITSRHDNPTRHGNSTRHHSSTSAPRHSNPPRHDNVDPATQPDSPTSATRHGSPLPHGSPSPTTQYRISAVRQRRHAILGKTVCHPKRSVRSGPAGNAHPRRPCKSCKRHGLYVDFTELGWDWIIAPAGYTAYYCKGHCPPIMGQHLRPTNHAVVQNIMGTLHPRVPPARCVPGMLRPISVLHYEENGSIIYKEYPDMVAMSCACR